MTTDKENESGSTRGAQEAPATAQLRAAHAELQARFEERTRELEAEIVAHGRAAEALKESDAFHQSLVDNLPVVIFRRDL